MAKKKKQTKKVQRKRPNKKRETKFPIIIKKTLNNKSRKGEYFYVKLKKGDKGKYFKAQKGVKRGDYAEASRYGLIRKRTGVKGITNIKRKVRQIKKRPQEIETSLKPGVAETRIQNPEKLSVYGMKVAYTRLLLNTGKAGDGKPIVRDKELIDILTVLIIMFMLSLVGLAVFGIIIMG